jgi:hypothetical protein
LARFNQDLGDILTGACYVTKELSGGVFVPFSCHFTTVSEVIHSRNKYAEIENILKTLGQTLIMN